MPLSSATSAETSNNTQTTTIISYVLQYFKRERDNKVPYLDVQKVSERGAASNI